MRSVPMMYVPHQLANDKGIKSPGPLGFADIENDNVHVEQSNSKISDIRTFSVCQ
jgi:hypothetical protein